MRSFRSFPINRLLVMFCVGLTATPLAAQTYKCTDAEGRIAYQQLPCPGQPVEANQVDVKPIATLGGGSASTVPVSAPQGRVEQQVQAPNGEIEEWKPIPPQQDRTGQNRNEMAWCQDQQNQYYPVPPGQNCSMGSRMLPAGTQPDLSQWNRPQPPIPVNPNRPLWVERAAPYVRKDPSIDSRHLSGDKDEACEQARANSKLQYDTNRDLSFSQRSALDEQVRTVCN